MGILNRIKNAWNTFLNKDPTKDYYNGEDRSVVYTSRPDRVRLTRGNERSIVNSIYTRIAMDVASINIKHCMIDDNGRFIEEKDSTLNNCLSVEANIDQTARSFMLDVVMSLLDDGCVAIVPIDTDYDIDKDDSYKILTMRTAKILEWKPYSIKISVYDDRSGRKREIYVSKEKAAIIENPFYSIMNEHNSTLQRLIHKLNLLDAVDEQSSAGKLDLIIQLPYSIKTPSKRESAELRRKDIEEQLTGSKYGIAYTDGTEHITQLNRPVDNNLMGQIEKLTAMLYGQLGISQAILEGTADEQQMLNYYNRTIEPIISAIVDELSRKFLTKTARTQGQSIKYFRDPFKLVPVNNIAEIADKFTRNEIMTSNEIRQIIGMKPSNDPKADELLNSNISHPEEYSDKELSEEYPRYRQDDDYYNNK